MTFVPKKLYYKIREVCDIAGVEAHVLRFWETEFPALAPPKSKSGQRTYRPRDIELILSIRKLLYEDGYTIAGARRQLGMRTPSGAVKKQGSVKSTSSPDFEIEGVVSTQKDQDRDDISVSPMKNDLDEHCEPATLVADTVLESEASVLLSENEQKPAGTSTRETLPSPTRKPRFEFVELRELPSAAPARLSFRGTFPTSSLVPQEDLRGVHEEAHQETVPLKKPLENNDEPEKPTSDRLKRVQAELENILTLLDRE